MTKGRSNSTASSRLVLLLGPILIISIALATANLLSTYQHIHHQKQESIWNVIQLDKELSNTLFNTQQYLNNNLAEEPLRLSYEVLWSRIPVTINSIKNDDIFSQINGITTIVDSVFDHVKSAEEIILEPGSINRVLLHLWATKLNSMAKRVSQQLLQNTATSNSEYSQNTATRIIKTAVILLVLVFAFVLYLGYLLLTLHKEQSRNRYMLDHDTLTGLYSRDLVMQTIDSHCENKHSFALLAFDLNKFKAVNDTFGHHAGDQLLKHLAEQFESTLSKFGIVGRIGGDEFLWIPHSDNPRIIQQQHDLFIRALEKPCLLNDKRIYLHISTGGGLAADYDFHPTQLIEHVDQAMYQAKSQQIKEIFWEKPILLKKPIKPNERKSGQKDRRADVATS